MIGPNSVFADFRCPFCHALQSARRMWRAMGSTRGAGHIFPRCGHELRLCDAGLPRYRLLCAVVALSSGLFGMWGASLFPGLTFINPAGVEKLNFAGFVAVMVLVVLPAVGACQRILKVEIVE